MDDKKIWEVKIIWSVNYSKQILSSWPFRLHIAQQSGL